MRRIGTPPHGSLVTRARRIANALLRGEGCTHPLFIDADIAFSPLLVPRMQVADKDVACKGSPI